MVRCPLVLSFIEPEITYKSSKISNFLADVALKNLASCICHNNVFLCKEAGYLMLFLVESESIRGLNFVACREIFVLVRSEIQFLAKLILELNRMFCPLVMSFSNVELSVAENSRRVCSINIVVAILSLYKAAGVWMKL